MQIFINKILYMNIICIFTHKRLFLLTKNSLLKTIINLIKSFKMKNLLLTMLLAVGLSLSVNAQVTNVKVKVTPLGDKLEGRHEVPFSSTTSDILINENFEALTKGTPEAPDFNIPLALLDTDVAINPELTHGLQWYGHKVYQAGGALAMQSLSMDQCILNTPRMDYSGSVKLTFITRALKSTWTDEEGKLMEDGSAHLIVGISDEQGRKIETNQTTSNLADLQMYEDMGWSEVTIEFDNYSAYNGVSIVFAGTRTLLLDDIKITSSCNEFIAVPSITGVTDITETSFTVHWEEVRKSYNYYVWLYTYDGKDPETGEDKYSIVFPKELLAQIDAIPDMTIDDYIESMGGIDSPHLKYDIVNRHGDLSYTFTDLDPSKEYCFAVMSHNVSMFSEKKLHRVEQLPTPEALEPTDFTDSSFKANWTKVTRADNYDVSLYGVNVVDKDDDNYELLREDFDKTSEYTKATEVTSGTPCTPDMTLDDLTSQPGWSVNGPLATETPDGEVIPLCYMLDGYFGCGMGLTLSSPELYVANNDFVNVEMHVKCENPDAPIVIQFAGSLYMSTMDGNTDAVASVQLPTNGLEKTKFEMACSDPNGLPLYIDYISITQPVKKGNVILTSLATTQLEAGETSLVFDNLDKYGYSVFAYDVTATKADGRTSEPSKRVFADLKNKTPYDPGTTDIECIGTTEGDVHEVARYTIDGVRLNAPAKGINIVRYSDGTTKKVVVR